MQKYNLFYAGYNKDKDEEQIGLLSSQDLENWQNNSNPIIKIDRSVIQTSNPCVLKIENLYKCWYQSKSNNGAISICYAESDDGENWQPQSEPILKIESESPDYREGYHHPHVYFDKYLNIYKMWCILYAKNDSFLAYSESFDGKNWNSPKVLFGVDKNKNESKIFYPFVLLENGIYKMWYTIKNKNGNWGIYFADSKNGIDWNREYAPVIAPKFPYVLVKFLEIISKIFKFEFKLQLNGIASPNIWKEDIYYLIGHSYGSHGRLFITLYSSIDGKKWIKVKNDILKNIKKEQWNNFFQGDPFMLIRDERK